MVAFVFPLLILPTVLATNSLEKSTTRRQRSEDQVGGLFDAADVKSELSLELFLVTTH